jgi:hypothetical protein
MLSRRIILPRAKSIFFSVIFLLSLLIASCNLPDNTNSNTAETAIIETFVAQTVMAQVTQDTSQAEETQDLATNTPNSSVEETQNPAPTNTSPPPETQTPTETPIPCNLARFVMDVTIPDGKVYQPGASFTKTWRLKNLGSCVWTSGYDIIFEGGDAMGAPSAVQITMATVDPGENVDVSVNLTAPDNAGTYRGNWKLRDPGDVEFGIENSSAGVFWVEIKVVTPTEEPTEFTKEFSLASRGMIEQGIDVRSNANNAGDTGADLGRQGFVTFDISSIPDGANILSAKLVPVSYDRLGDPFGSLGCLRAYVDNYGVLKLNDYTAPGITGSMVRFCNDGDMNDSNDQTMNISGISGIESALASNTFKIRLQFNDGHSDGDGIADVIRGTFKIVVRYEN